MSISKNQNFSLTTVWTAGCKDCEAERISHSIGKHGGKPPKKKDQTFQYSADWARKLDDRGFHRSDRCERHRQHHQQIIKSFSVAYINLKTIGTVLDRSNPTGPLGGLGPLPIAHSKETNSVNLEEFEFGMKDQHVVELLEALKTKKIAVVEAGTGSGKSTFLPFRLMNPPEDSEYRITENGPIVITEPRRAAATGVSAFVGEQLCFRHDPAKCKKHTGPGYPVGYQVRGEKHWDSACQLIYVTDGTMINWIRDGKLSSIGAVIIDEAHERSENIDIILTQLKEQHHLYPELRIIVTSATINKSFFVDYFGGEKKVHYQFVESVKSFGYGVPLFADLEVSDKTISDGMEIGSGQSLIKFEGWSNYDVVDGSRKKNAREFSNQLAKLRVNKVIDTTKWKERMPSIVAEQVIKIIEGTKGGDVLAFLPTRADIELAVGKIRKGLRENGNSCDVYTLLSTTPKNEQIAALKARSDDQKRKIVVSSNLAETSLTVKGVRFVVDSGLICQSDWDPEIVSDSFPTKVHSKSGVKQRWGRVGRDSPGWVFPLYSIEQFLSFPNDTPPGSCLCNLETFVMKLISAGIDITTAELPPSFQSENVQLDEEGTKYSDTFKKEIVRSEKSLKLAGAIDTDGHLTSFGRDLDRFSCSGSEAISIMLADQLTCLHEVVLANIVLGGGLLYDAKGQGILLMDIRWPHAWKVEANHRHKSLGIGCIDDLDLLLRIFSEYQSAEISSNWCQEWWINELIVQDSIKVVYETIDLLSAGMKKEAARNFDISLGGKARIVLALCMKSHKYMKNKAGEFYSLHGDGSEKIVELSEGSLIPATNSFIAMHRFRVQGEENQQSPPIVSHVVMLPDWVGDEIVGDALMGLKALEFVTNSPSSYNALLEASGRSHRLVARIRSKYPVGSIFQLTGKKLVFISQGLKPPIARGYDSQEKINDISGFDREWDPYTSRIAKEIPKEELDQNLINIHELEINDEFYEGEESSIRNSKEILGDQINISLKCASDVLKEPVSEFKIITGYGLKDENSLDLYTRDVDRSRIKPDPALHDDLQIGDVIDLIFIGMEKIQHFGVFEFLRADNNGSFYLSDRERLIGNGVDCVLNQLKPGSKLSGLFYIDSNGHHCISLLPYAYNHLSKSKMVNASYFGKLKHLFPAKIVEESNYRGHSVVELLHLEKKTGLVHRFERKIAPEKRIKVEVGNEVLLELELSRSHKNKKIKTQNPNVFRFIESNSRYFDVLKSNTIAAKNLVIPYEVISELAECDDSVAWKKQVWEFYIDHFHMNVKDIFPILVTKETKFKSIFKNYVFRCKAKIGKEYSVDITVKDTENTVSVAGVDETAVDDAIAELEKLNNLPCVRGEFPRDYTSKLIGSNGIVVKNMRARQGILDVQVEDGSVLIVGLTATIVQNLIDEIASKLSSYGVLEIPNTMMGKFIGSRGEHVKNLSRKFNCRINNKGRSNSMRIESESKYDIERLISYCKQEFPGASGSLSKEKCLRITEQNAMSDRGEKANIVFKIINSIFN